MSRGGNVSDSADKTSMSKYVYRPLKYVISIVLLLISFPVFSAPTMLTYQGRILKSDGTPLEYSNVSFIFQIINPAESCVIYEEQVSNYNMQNSNGVFDTAIGGGVRSFPSSGTFTVLDSLNNVAALACKSGGPYTPAPTDSRKLRVLFHDGGSWKTISPDSEIRSVPYAGYAASADKFANKPVTDFVLKNLIPVCGAGTVLSWNGTAFACASAPAVSGTVMQSQFPASCAANQTLTFVSPSSSFICSNIAINGSQVSGNIAGTAAGFTGALVGDVSGNQGTTSVDKIKGVPLSMAGNGSGKVLTFDGTNWAPADLPASGAETDPKVGANINNYLSKWDGSALVASGLFESGGNFGIGTSNPQAKLDVNGVIRATNICDENGANCKDISTGWAAGGASALNDLSDARKTSSSIFIGHEATSTTGNYNTSVGINAMLGALSADNAVAIGYDALKATTFSGGNTAVGAFAMRATTIGSSNTGVGKSALSNNTTGSSNTAIGGSASYSNTTGQGNSALGESSLVQTTTGSSNTGIGVHSLYKNREGNDNTALGAEAGGFQDFTGLGYMNRNLVLGSRAGRSMQGGASDGDGADNNVLMGFQAGDSLTTGDSNILIGYDVDVPTATTSNHLNIGGAIFGNLSNGNIGIGRTAPQAKLDVNGIIRATEICDENGANCKDISTGWGGGAGGTVTNVTASGPLSVTNGTTAPAISISQANTSTDGYVSFSDWNKFDSKLGTATIFTGDVTGTYNATAIANNAVTTGKIQDGTITGADLNFAGVNTATTSFVMKDSTGSFYNFACVTTGHVPTWTASGFACQAPTVTEADPKVGVNATNYLSKWDGSALIASGVYESGGNVGIGTTNPLAQVHLHNQASNSKMQLTDADSGAVADEGAIFTYGRGNLDIIATDPANSWPTIGLWAGSNYIQMQDDRTIFGKRIEPQVGSETLPGIGFPGNGMFFSGGGVAFSTNNVERMRMDNLGNVGIGTSSPAMLLDIKKNVNAQIRAGVRNANSGSSASANFSLESDVSYLELKQFSSSSPSVGSIQPNGASIAANGSGGLSIAAFDSSGEIRFYSGGASERMRVLANGNVGINTASPQATLDVNGIIRATNICDETGANCKDISTGWGGGASGTVTNVTASGPLSVTNGTTAPAITISQANASTDGYVSFSDWNKFDSKLGTTTTFTGDVTGTYNATAIANNAVTTGKILDGTIAGADLNFSGVNTATTNFVMKDSAGSFYNFGCTALGHVPTWTASGFACQAPTVTETDPKVGANTTHYLSKWDGGALVASGLYENAGNVGIGMGAGYPAATFDIRAGGGGKLLFTDGGPSLIVSAGIKGITNFAGATAGLGFYTSPGPAQANFDNSVEQMRIAPSGNVGINTTAPSTRLHVVGTSGATLRIVDGNEGANKVLTSDANGVASWQAPATGGLTNFIESVNTSSPNATVPIVSLTVNNAATNADISLQPKGSGALTRGIADDTLTGGNKRGADAVDWQNSRTLASQVASGTSSSITGGHKNTASGSFSTVAGGSTNTASQMYAMVGGGTNNTASGQHTFIGGGEYNTVSGQYSVALGGSYNSATGQAALVSGVNTTAQARNQVTFGQYNMPKGGENGSSWVTTDPLFVIGNGTGSGASRSNALMVLKNGNVGIGMTAPSSKLSVSGNSGTLPAPNTATIAHFANADGGNSRIMIDAFAGAPVIDFRRSNTTAASPSPVLLDENLGQFSWYGYGTNAYSGSARAVVNVSASENWTNSAQGTAMRFYTTDSGSTSMLERMRISAGGNVGIGVLTPTEKLEVAGNIRATAFLVSSDRSLKYDIKNIKAAVDTVMKIKGVKFKWKENGREDIGFIAQQIEQVLPELVHTDPVSGIKSVQYSNVVAVLVAAIQEQQVALEKEKEVNLAQNQRLDEQAKQIRQIQSVLKSGGK